MKILKERVGDYLLVIGVAVMKLSIAQDGGEGSGNFNHSGRPGKIGGSGYDSHTNRQETMNIADKISKVKIDFTKDNILPELNKEDLEELGVESKPVLLKKSIIERNLSQHPEVSKQDYERLAATALYNADAIIPGNAEKPYYNFIARVSDEKNSVVLLEVSENKDNFEIVHLHWAKDKQRRTLERKAKNINKS